MRILSLNVNDFGGKENFLEGPTGIKSIYGYPEYLSKWNDIQSLYDVDSLYNFLIDVDADIIIFQEYFVNSTITKVFTQQVEKLGYYFTLEKSFIKNPSMTVMFSKAKYTLKNSPHNKTQKTLRSVQIKTQDTSLIGTHIPYNSDFWDELISFYENNNTKSPVVMIGDFNIWLEKADNDLTKYQELLKAGAVDIGRKLNQPTRGNKRIDFAFVSKELEKSSNLCTTPCTINGDYFDSIVSKNLSDHEALILDIDFEI